MGDIIKRIDKATENLTKEDLAKLIKESVDKWSKNIEEAKDDDIVAYFMGIPFTKKELIEAWLKDQEGKEGAKQN